MVVYISVMPNLGIKENNCLRFLRGPLFLPYFVFIKKQLFRPVSLIIRRQPSLGWQACLLSESPGKDEGEEREGKKTFCVTRPNNIKNTTIISTVA